jgi:hypothetical protein
MNHLGPFRRRDSASLNEMMALLTLALTVVFVILVLIVFA